MKSIRDVSLVLEGSRYCTSSDVLLYTIKLLYERLDSTKMNASTTPFKADFVARFKKKLLTFLDDENQFYSWSLCSYLDGRRSHLEWLDPVWQHKEDWPNVTKKYSTRHIWRNLLMEEVGNMVSPQFPMWFWRFSAIHIVMLTI